MLHFADVGEDSEDSDEWENEEPFSPSRKKKQSPGDRSGKSQSANSDKHQENDTIDVVCPKLYSLTTVEPSCGGSSAGF